jgi:hypothetical protein
MGDGWIFLKTFRTSLFKDDLSNEKKMLAGSISLDSTFKGTQE